MAEKLDITQRFKVSNAEIFRHCGLDIHLAVKVRGRPDYVAVGFLTDLLNQATTPPDLREKLLKAIKMINDRSFRRDAKLAEERFMRATNRRARAN